MKANSIIISGLALLLAVQTSCRENEYGTVDLTMPSDTTKYEDIDAVYTFNHPCAMYSQSDFDRVKASLDGDTAPSEVQLAYQSLRTSQYASLTHQANPQEKIVRGDPTGTGYSSENYVYAMRDAAAAYQMALVWKLSGDDQYAAKAVEILNAWAATCKEITSNDANNVLAAGAQGYTFANAAEILRDYSGWSTSDFTVFCNWMVDVFASVNREFMDHNNSSVCVYHYWSNWDLVNLCSYLSIGILTENNDMVNYVVNYFHNGVGNGCISNLIQGTFDDPLGTGEEICQNQESGRDQGHAMMSTMVAANLCQMAYTLYTQNPSVGELDFFATNDNAILKMTEYVALSNLRSGTDNQNSTGTWLVTSTQMPFSQYLYCHDCGCNNWSSHTATHTQIADDSGRGGLRPGWEIVYNHYAKVKGLSSGYIYTQMFADKLRPECGASDSRYGSNSGAFDQLGWGTLMLYR